MRWKGHIQAGTSSDRVSGFEDWMPTLLELAGLESRIPNRIDGISLTPTLHGKNQEERPFLYREFSGYGGQQMVRIGDWKGIRQKLIPKAKAKPQLDIELYNIKLDIAETTNVASQHPDIVSKIEKTMREQHVSSQEFPFAALDSQ
jgi:arylsulfatase A-like enzyme